MIVNQSAPTLCFSATRQSCSAVMVECVFVSRLLLWFDMLQSIAVMNLYF